jgi:hypothetical protein
MRGGAGRFRPRDRRPGARRGGRSRRGIPLQRRQDRRRRPLLVELDGRRRRAPARRPLPHRRRRRDPEGPRGDPHPQHRLVQPRRGPAVRGRLQAPDAVRARHGPALRRPVERPRVRRHQGDGRRPRRIGRGCRGLSLERPVGRLARRPLRTGRDDRPHRRAPGGAAVELRFRRRGHENALRHQRQGLGRQPVGGLFAFRPGVTGLSLPSFAG